MPLKITTETDLVRLLSNTPLQLEVYFMKLKSHTPKNTPIEHMMMFYKDFAELSKQKFDGMIVTGAPIETMEYEEGGVLAGNPGDIQLGTYPRYLYAVYLLGCAGWTLSLLWCSKISA